MRSKWADFDDPSYTIVDLGRPAVFLVPSHKLRLPMKDQDVETCIRDFLMDKFGAFSTTMVPQFGFWRAEDGRVDYDECRRYEVSFLGKEPIGDLMRLLAEICKVIEEDCIYFKAGQYTYLIYPNKLSSCNP